MTEHFQFDGRFLHWNEPRDGIRSAKPYKATSGLEGHQFPNEQCAKEMGPVPVGNYRVLLRQEVSDAKVNPRELCGLLPGFGVEVIPPHVGQCVETYSAWGKHRARFLPADQATKERCPDPRTGLYLHDSTKGYSHGCIEVEPAFFTRFINYCSLLGKGFIPLKVQYKYDTTNGGTKV